MKQIIPFKKELEFKNNLAEVTSISLDHTLKCDCDKVVGNLILTGSYKINDTSVNVEEFNFELPIDISISDKYDITNLEISIDDFYYEIIDNSVLSVAIDIALDNLEERTFEEIEPVYQEITDIEPEEERVEVEEVKNLFDSFDESSETYATYRVFIVKEGDTLESIILKYNVTREILEKYNDLTNLKIGDKIIIPTVYNARV